MITDTYGRTDTLVARLATAISWLYVASLALDPDQPADDDGLPVYSPEKAAVLVKHAHAMLADAALIVGSVPLDRPHKLPKDLLAELGETDRVA